MNSPSLRRDERGAIMVVGVFMCTLLIALVWRLVGVGDAILFKERVQEAADATAFETAVSQARSMNMLVVLNILMAAVLSVLVMLRVAKFGVEALMVICGAASVFCPWLVPLQAPLASADSALTAAENPVAQTVDKILKGLQVLAKGVATLGGPWATIQGITNNNLYWSKPVAFTAAGGLSLLPIESLRSLAGQAKSKEASPQTTDHPTPAGNTSSGWVKFGEMVSFPERTGRPFSLPVENDDFSQLCAKAAGFVPDQISALLETFHLPSLGSDIVGNFMTTIGKNMSSTLCGTSGARQDATKKAEGSSKDIGNAACEEQFQKEEPSGKHGSNWVTDHRNEQCRRNVEKANDTTAPTAVTVQVQPTKVWNVAGNGGIFFQVWGVAKGTPRRLPVDDSAVRFGTKSSEGAPTPVFDPSNWAIADAEMYYDSPDAWDNVEAMWNLKWRARMRRWHFVADVDLGQILVGWLHDVTDRMGTQGAESTLSDLASTGAVKPSAIAAGKDLLEEELKRNLKATDERETFIRNVSRRVTDFGAAKERSNILH